MNSLLSLDTPYGEDPGGFILLYHKILDFYAHLHKFHKFFSLDLLFLFFLYYYRLHNAIVRFVRDSRYERTLTFTIGLQRNRHELRAPLFFINLFLSRSNHLCFFHRNIQMAAITCTKNFV